MQFARVSILRAEKENGYLDVASILGPPFVWERSANVPAPSLTKAQHGCCGSLSSTNVQHLRATARFSSHFTEVCKVDSHVSHRFPPIHLTHRRTFALFTIIVCKNLWRTHQKLGRAKFSLALILQVLVLTLLPSAGILFTSGWNRNVGDRTLHAKNRHISQKNSVHVLQQFGHRSEKSDDAV